MKGTETRLLPHIIHKQKKQFQMWKVKQIQVQEDNIGKYLGGLGGDKHFLYTTWKALIIKKKKIDRELHLN